jgi:hypothetical protein
MQGQFAWHGVDPPISRDPHPRCPWQGSSHVAVFCTASEQDAQDRLHTKQGGFLSANQMVLESMQLRRAEMHDKVDAPMGTSRKDHTLSN